MLFRPKIRLYEFIREMLALPLSNHSYESALDLDDPLSDEQQCAFMDAAPDIARAYFFLWLYRQTVSGGPRLRADEVGYQFARASQAAYADQGIAGGELESCVSHAARSLESYLAALGSPAQLPAGLDAVTLLCSHFADLTVPVDRAASDARLAAHIAASQFALRVALQVQDALEYKMGQVQIVA